MSWRYIPSVETFDDGSQIWGIREYYEPDDSHGNGWTAFAVEPEGFELHELRDTIQMMLASFDAGDYLDVKTGKVHRVEENQ